MGYAGIAGIAFVESGFLVGFFLPGDSLLFAAGFLASAGTIDLELVIIAAFLGAVLGDSFGYMLGFRLGPKVFKKENSFIFHKSHIERAKNFYEKHGGKTIVIARFLPIIRTFAPVLAGVGKMKYSAFVFYNIFGGLLWTISLTVLGFILGGIFPNLHNYILFVILGIIIISVAPTMIGVLKNKQYREYIKKHWKNLLNTQKSPE